VEAYAWWTYCARCKPRRVTACDDSIKQSRRVVILVLEIWLLITCIYSHACWMRNATTIICYARLNEECSTTINLIPFTTSILHTRCNMIKHQSHGTKTGTLTITEEQPYPRLHIQPAAGHLTIPWGIMIKPRNWFGKENAASAEWEKPRREIVHALVACRGGRLGYKEACFSLYLFTISSSHFVPLCLRFTSFFTAV